MSTTFAKGLMSKRLIFLLSQQVSYHALHHLEWIYQTEETREESRAEGKLNSDNETPRGGSGADLRTPTRERYKPTRYGDNIYD